jgi:hypothetical protein
MFNYMFNTSNGYNTGLLFIVFFLTVVLLSMVYYTNKDKNKLRTEINSLTKNIKELKEENENQLDELNNEMLTSDDISPTQCPDCNCPETKECPVCPKCPENTCPTVDDIISGIFPGRNTGVTNSGRYFDVQGNESYELFPDYDFYQPSDAFPSDSILKAPDNLLTGTMNIPGNQINNTYNNDMLLTQNDNDIDSRMTRGYQGENTSPTSFGEGTEIYAGDIASDTNMADRAVAAALSDEGDPFNIQEVREGVNYVQTNPDGSTTTLTPEERESIRRDQLSNQGGG